MPLSKSVKVRATVAGALSLLVLPGAALAGDRAPIYAEAAPQVTVTPASEPDFIFTLRGGVASAPEYFGSGDYTVGPDFSFGFGYLRLPGGRSFGSIDPNMARDGFGLRGSFRYIDERSAEESPELAGLDTVDATAELGVGLSYSSYNFDAFADMRYGVIGHESVVGELGADVKMHPTSNLTLSVGPRVLLGSDDYVDTYFGVSPAESTANMLAGGNFGAYDPEGGVVSAGIEVGASYRLDDNWGIEGAVTWDRFTGDAENSPIVQQGERDQYGIRVGITRRIVLDF
ncbi:MipA/OmpV family protein [Profundibacterium mesophilum]|uniref:Outer membrane protein CC n=1 Tax=Profundibacterium mesophilum KAUST100406-0324 TaxID=1037889 RepID=A0A921NP75_9RHOB|nr:MipA/OmpV family protein [Profundibacterium mesophilum]KAF0675786.1 putative outer membrane protein CC [Profundibacterium mesophilum KAUST100406-0324]